MNITNYKKKTIKQKKQKFEGSLIKDWRLIRKTLSSYDVSYVSSRNKSFTVKTNICILNLCPCMILNLTTLFRFSLTKN